MTYNRAVTDHDDAIRAGAANIGADVAARLRRDAARLQVEWAASAPVRHFVVDDLLPPDEARALGAAIPPSDRLMLKKSLREQKRVGVDVRRYDPIIGAGLFAFQQPAVLAAVEEITGLQAMAPDPTLYASGISVMAKGDYLRPHLDNSHDGDQRLYRVINLLFYVSPDWDPRKGGNLELWDDDVRQANVIECRFNRLAVMATNRHSWHSVQKVLAAQPRICFSNYYFSPVSPEGQPYRNVTSFRGRPEEPFVRAALWADRHLLNAVGRAFPFLLTRNRHRLEDRK